MVTCDSEATCVLCVRHFLSRSFGGQNGFNGCWHAVHRGLWPRSALRHPRVCAGADFALSVNSESGVSCVRDKTELAEALRLGYQVSHGAPSKPIQDVAISTQVEAVRTTPHRAHFLACGSRA